jgi:hypothetical protein
LPDPVPVVRRSWHHPDDIDGVAGAGADRSPGLAHRLLMNAGTGHIDATVWP